MTTCSLGTNVMFMSNIQVFSLISAYHCSDLALKFMIISKPVNTRILILKWQVFNAPLRIYTSLKSEYLHPQAWPYQNYATALNKSVFCLFFLGQAMVRRIALGS